MYYIHIVKRFRAHCGFYAIENKLLLLLLLYTRGLIQVQDNYTHSLTITIALRVTGYSHTHIAIFQYKDII